MSMDMRDAAPPPRRVGRTTLGKEMADRYAENEGNLAALCIEAAEDCKAWSCIKEDLVPGPGGRLAGANTGRLFRLYKGALFAPGAYRLGSVGAAKEPLWFRVVAGRLEVYEVLFDSKPWWEIMGVEAPKGAKARRRIGIGRRS